MKKSTNNNLKLCEYHLFKLKERANRWRRCNFK